MNVDDALTHLVSVLKSGSVQSRGGYDFAMEDVLWEYMRQHQGFTSRNSTGKDDQHMGALSPAFLDASWELCRRGILRPGGRDFGHSVMGGREIWRWLFDNDF